VRRHLRYLSLLLISATLRTAWVVYDGITIGPDTANFLSSCQYWLGNPAGIFGIEAIAGIEYAGATLPMCLIIEGADLGYSGFVAYQVLLSSASTVLLYDTCRREWDSELAGLVAGIVFAGFWPTFQWVNWILTDVSFIFVLTVGLWSNTRYRTVENPTLYDRILVVGATIAIGFTRPVGLLVAVGWLLWGSLGEESVRVFGYPLSGIGSAVVVVVTYLTLSSRDEFSAQLLDIWRNGVLVLDDPTFSYEYVHTPASTVFEFILRNPVELIIMGVLKTGLLFLPFVGRFSGLHKIINLTVLVPPMLLSIVAFVRLIKCEDTERLMTWGWPAVAMTALIAATFWDFDWRYRAPYGPIFIGLSAMFVPRVREWAADEYPGARKYFRKVDL
jgi:hypothetical protein